MWDDKRLETLSTCIKKKLWYKKKQYRRIQHISDLCNGTLVCHHIRNLDIFYTHWKIFKTCCNNSKILFTYNMSPNLFFQVLFLETAVSKYVIFNLAFQNLQLLFVLFAFVTHYAIIRIAILKLKIILFVISLSFVIYFWNFNL